MKFSGIAIVSVVGMLLAPASVLAAEAADTPSNVVEQQGDDEVQHKKMKANLRSRSLEDVSVTLPPAETQPPVIIGTAPPTIAPTTSPTVQPTAMPGAPYWETITEDTFETSWGNFRKQWDNAANNVQDPDDARWITNPNEQTWVKEGNGALRIRDNGGIESSVWHKQNLDVTGYTNLMVNFYVNGRSCNAGDKLFVEYSSNGGAGWTVMKEYLYEADFHNNYNRGRQIDFNFQPVSYDLTNQARIRFRSETQGDGNYIYIDKVKFSGFVELPPTLSPTSMPTSSLQPTASPSVQPTVSPTPYWKTITEDTFEDGWGSFRKMECWKAVDPDDAWRIANPSSDEQLWVRQGTAALRIRNHSLRLRDSSVWHVEDHNVAEYSKVKVEFWFASRNCIEGEMLILESSCDSGKDGTWNVQTRWYYTIDWVSNDVFENLSFSWDIDPCEKFRIRLRVDTYGRDGSFYVDEIKVEGFVD